MMQDAYLTQWMDKLRSDALAPKRAEAERLIVEPWLLAIYLASVDADNSDDFANAVGILPAVLDELMPTPEGRRLAAFAKLRLLRSGGADLVRISQLMGPLFDVVEQGVVDGAVTGPAAVKVLEVIAKLKASHAESGAARAEFTLTMFEGTAAELAARIVKAFAAPVAIQSNCRDD